MLHTHIVLQKRIHVSALASSSLLVILLALAFFPIASSYSSTLAAPAPSETTLSMTAESINLNLSVDNANGTFNASDPANLTVATNNYTGYTLSLLASSNDADATKLVNGENSISSISSVSSESDFNVGNWGIKPSKVNSAANNSYIPAPTAEGTTIDATNAANAEANSYTIALGAKADYSLPAGRYSNTFVLVAVVNPVGYVINYSAGTDDDVENMPENQVGDLDEDDILVSDNAPTRQGYNFSGWCSGVISNNTCSDTVYQPGDVFVTNYSSQNILNLEAMWEVGTLYLQNLNEANMATLMPNVGDTVIAYDRRDDRAYEVGKLADGRYWMLDNLAIDLYVTDLSMLKGNTNATDYSLESLKGLHDRNPDEDPMGNRPTSGIITTYEQALTKPYSYVVDKDLTSSTDSGSSETFGAAADWKYGGYYNYCAISAGTYCYGTSTEFPKIILDSGITEDICPAGWRLPTIKGGVGEYQNLVTELTGEIGSFTNDIKTQQVRSALHIPFPGIYSSGQYNLRGERIYLSSSSGSGYDPVNIVGTSNGILTIQTNKLNAANGISHEVTQSVRCIAKRSYTVAYDANGGVGTMDARISDDEYISLDANAFSKDGYTFAGWNTASDGSGVFYPDGSYYTVPTGNSTVTLYAQWAQNTFDSVFASAKLSKTNGYYKMQDMRPYICDAVSVGQTGSLIDTRDNHVYTIGKMPDGKCWLLDNMALNLTDAAVKANILPSDTTISAYYPNTNSSTYAKSMLYYGTANDGKYSKATVKVQPSIISSYSKPYIVVSNLNTTNTSDSITEAQSYKYGVYYNYCATASGGYCYGSDSSAGTSSGTPIDDICPYGWRLPTGGDGGEYSSLYGYYDSVDSFRVAFHAPLSGYVTNFNSVLLAGNGGFFWSSSRKDDSYMYVLRVNGASVDTQASVMRNYSASVRCVVK